MSNVILILWAGVLGGIFGSFLNVVVFRLPRGRSISFPPSHCPKCKFPIRWYDNIPIFGWLLLNGRCRDCKTRISMRYPVVETVCALVFALFTLLIVVLEGGPVRPTIFKKTEHLILYSIPQPDSNALWASDVYLLVLLITLFGAGLIEADMKKITKSAFVPRLFLPATVLGLIGTVFFPSLHWVPFYALGWPLIGIRDWLYRYGEWTRWGCFSGIPDALVGTVAAFLIGRVTAYLFSPAYRANWTAGLMLVGFFLGWQHR